MQQMDKTPLGSKIAPKTRAIIYYAELGKPYAFPTSRVSTPQGEETTQRVKEQDKKRMAFCNETYRGSKFAPIRKGADLSHGIS